MSGNPRKVIDRARLNERQLSLLKRVAEGDDLSGDESLGDRASAYALSNRGLIKTSKRGGVFTAAITGPGRARIASEQAAAEAQQPRRSAGSGAPSASKRRAPDATVEIANARAAQAKELMAKLSVQSTFRVVQPTEDELATWRKVVDFAKRNGFVPEGKRLEKNITSRKDLAIMLLDGAHPNTKPATPSAGMPTVRVPETLRACHPVVAKLRDDERRLLMPKLQRRRCLLILQAVAAEAQRRGHRVKDEPVATDRRAYYGDSVRARDGAIRVEVDGHGFAVRVSQVSPNSENPERSEALVIEVPSYRVSNRQTKWPDGKRRKVEDVLDLIIPELETQAAEAKQRKIDEERAKAERRANWEKAMTRAKAAAATAYKAKILNQQVENWRRAATLREYCDALADRIAQAEHGEEQVDDATLAWANWITEYTATIDPLTSIPRMPDAPEPSPEDLKPFLGKWSPYGPEESNYGYGWRS
jgi:hypothetical protein